MLSAVVKASPTGTGESVYLSSTNHKITNSKSEIVVRTTSSLNVIRVTGRGFELEVLSTFPCSQWYHPYILIIK